MMVKTLKKSSLLQKISKTRANINSEELKRGFALLNTPRIKQHRGAVLLMFMLITIMVGAALALKALNLTKLTSIGGSDREILVQAKDALLGYSISFAAKNTNQLPGYLPCPDTTGDGMANTPCGGVNRSSIGRLPWKTLGLQPTRDSAGECLWYAVSGGVKENPKGALSTETVGQFLLFDASLNSLNSNNNSNSAYAIVFAPGRPINGQNRSVTMANATECGSTLASDGINRSANYLETLAGINNANGGYTAGSINGLAVASIPTLKYSVFVESGVKSAEYSESYNDLLISITPVDFEPVFKSMQQWVGERVRRCLLEYSNNNSGKLPWPAILEQLGEPTYSDDANQRFGRVASNLTNTGISALSSVWPIDPMQAGTQCFKWSWWPAFKETIFYAMDDSVKPGGSGATPSLTVDGNLNGLAILVAGRKQAAQLRRHDTEKGSINNYLETENITGLGAGVVPAGDENFVTKDGNTEFFNDYVCTLLSCP